MMDQESSPGQVTDRKIDPFSGRNALILNQGSFSCPANQCGSPLSSLQKHISFRQIQERNASVPLPEIPFIPDLVFLRLSLDASAQKLIDSCKRTWNRAAMIALFCRASSEPTDDFPSLFGALDDFVSCPFRESELILRVKRLLQSKRTTNASSETLKGKEKFHFVSMVGESPCFLRVIKKIPLIADSEATLLISGETGSGKEVVARAIHYQGPRQGKPFIPVNCGALPDHLFENELFGHTKGAFTDASSSEQGLIAEAEGGTLLLDEIDTLSHSGQIKLLRFLQNEEYRPIGSSRFTFGDVRIIAVTNADLVERVKAKAFREDLYYRLNSLSLRVPPLRERSDDLVLLVNYFLNRYALEHGQKPRDISQAALRQLMAYSWPGNVRELESVLTRALVYNVSEILQADDIEIPDCGPKECHTQILREAKNSTIGAFERSYLAKLLAEHQGNITHAAKAAGKERRSFQRLLRKHNLNRQLFRF